MTSMHAYLIQAHGSFEQLALLLKALDDDRNEIFVHIDAKAGDFPREMLEESVRKSRLHFTKRICVNWGGPSQIWSELILLDEATKEAHFDYYHLLSGADFPLRSQDEIHSFFDSHKGTEFVAFWTLKNTTYSRFVYVPCSEYGSKWWGNLINNIFKGVQLLLGRGNPRADTFRYGPNWFSITDELAREVISQKDAIRATFSHRCNCDEIFLQTIVWNSPFKQKCYSAQEVPSGTSTMENARFVDWSRGKSVRHPWVFTKDDYTLLRSRGEMFARKFDISLDREILNMLYRDITSEAPKN